MALADPPARPARQRLAVTGANGWLGRAVVRAAHAAGGQVVGIVRSSTAVEAVTAAGGEAFVAPELDPDLLAEGLRGCSALVHLAGISAERDGVTYDEGIIGAMRKAIQAARRAEVPRILYFSGLGVARYGISRRSTNGYFLAKLSAEVELFRAGVEAVVFRPSYIVGPEDELIPALLQEIATGTVEVVGDGRYRLQPIALGDACDAVLAASRIALPAPSVFDLVGPEPIQYRDFVERVAVIGRGSGQGGAFQWREVCVEAADRQAASGGYRGFLPDELDVLLCDETADPEPLRRLLGRALTPLDEALQRAATASRPRAGAAFRRSSG